MKLTEKQVEQIRDLYAQGYNSPEVGRIFKINPRSVLRIVRFEIRKVPRLKKEPIWVSSIIPCLTCGRDFKSINKKTHRICHKCKPHVNKSVPVRQQEISRSVGYEAD